MGSALGLARRTLRWRLFQSAPCSTCMALSRSSSLLNVTKANVCFPKTPAALKHMKTSSLHITPSLTRAPS
uniref:Uncharacterized protein n=1 Tax=Corvus moneduloides TaxID=1196302 RepID=A0A8C3E1G8_CORMO